MSIALEVQNITKQFPGTLANDRVSLTLEKGEVHALLGENGAGKTTLMNIVYGLYHQDEGKVLVDGKEETIHNPQDAIKLGIGMVHQHFMLVPVFTVAENIILGHENTRGGVMLDRRTASQRIREVSQQYGLEIDPDALVKDLPVGIQQRVEIVKALYRNAKILILDEPTAVLTPQEADDLFRIMRELTGRGVSIFFITHKLKEVLAAADRITVLRAGHVVGTTKPAETNEAKLAAMMVGREVILKVDRGPAHPTDEVLNVNDLQVADDRGVMTVNGASFNVRAGEVLGIAGVQGNGQTQLVEALTGLRKIASGSIHLLSSDITKSSPRTITELGSAHIPEDRQRHGLVLAYPLTDNMVLNTYYQQPFARSTIMDEVRIKQNADRLVEEFDVRTPASTVATKTLSGGNQQKVIVAREFSRPIKLLIANQPTRGLDVGSIEYIHRRIIEKRDEGCAVLVVSAELDEILALSDRIAVMYHGRIVAVMPSAEATREKLGLLMAGITG
ncbi:MAG: ABC transporter ATP-binding protein [Chloroflexi bacterium]|nr:ABC transporter ATP-binding protein [Chloroflexota bacterium]